LRALKRALSAVALSSKAVLPFGYFLHPSRNGRFCAGKKAAERKSARTHLRSARHPSTMSKAPKKPQESPQYPLLNEMAHPAQQYHPTPAPMHATPAIESALQQTHPARAAASGAGA
jgi:hypothetical protein